MCNCNQGRLACTRKPATLGALDPQQRLDAARGAQPAPGVVPAGWRIGVEAVARLIEKKADDYALEFGHDDMGGLSFGSGDHAEAKSDYHHSLIELAEEVRAMLDAAPVPAVQGDAFAWATFDGEGGYDLRLVEDNEDYQQEYIATNGPKYAGWVFPLYRQPAAQQPEQLQDLITRTIGFEFEPGELQTVNSDDLLRLCAAARKQQAEQVPVAWQFFQDGNWRTGGETRRTSRYSVEAAGYPVRDLYPAPPAAPAQDISAVAAEPDAVDRAIDWLDSQALAEKDEVNEALRAFSGDSTLDNATALVIAIRAALAAHKGDKS